MPAPWEPPTVRVIRIDPPAPVSDYRAEHGLAFGSTTRATAAARLLLAIAEQERDDALADAAALKANRDALELELRAARLRENSDHTLLTAARHVGREQEREIEQLTKLVATMRGGRDGALLLLHASIRRCKAYRAEIADLHGLLKTETRA